jgi:hypothetical protein
MKRIVKQMTVSYKPGSKHLGMTPVSCIRITNNLLKKYGFNYQDKIMVVYEKGQIILCTLKVFRKKYE